MFITLSPTGTEVTGFNKMGSQSFGALEHTDDNGCKYTEDTGSIGVVDRHNLDNEEGC
jgi:hypothetical protein